MTMEKLRFFTPAPEPADEARRQAAVDRLRLGDTAEDPRLAAIVARVAALFGTPQAVISIIDRDRQQWIVRHGIDGTGTPRAISFCGHAVFDPGSVLAVPDARDDSRFAGNPLVTGAIADLRFYAGAPLLLDGAALGSLCAIDERTHPISDAQKAELKRLADEVVAILGADYRKA